MYTGGLHKFADVITKATLYPLLFKDPVCSWSILKHTHSLRHDQPVLNQLSPRCTVEKMNPMHYAEN